MTNDKDCVVVEEILASLERAHKELCGAVERQWSAGAAFKLSIPANEKEDTDLIIGSALRDAETAIRALVQERDDAVDDFAQFENSCWLCANPDSGLPERHVHEPQGGHWHHYIDPGDGLPSPCKSSELLEQIFQELVQERDAALKRAEAAEEAALKGWYWFDDDEEECGCNICGDRESYRKDQGVKYVPKIMHIHDCIVLHIKPNESAIPSETPH